MRVVVSTLFPNLEQTGKRKKDQVLRNDHLQVQDPNVFLGEPVGEFCNHLNFKCCLTRLTIPVLRMSNSLIEKVKLVPRVFLHQM